MCPRTNAILGLLLLGALGRAEVPFGIPAELIAFMTPRDNPQTPEKIELGRTLFHDKRLSADDTVSCATCHDPEAGFTARLATAKGIRDQTGMRNTPTVLSAMFFDTQFWDGRAPTLEEQAKMPILNPIEMGMKDGAQVVAKLAAIPEYRDAFQKVFGRALNYDDVGRALAAFERTLISGDAPIDRFAHGDENALTPAQRRGWTLFNGKGRCLSCHSFNPSYPVFTDNLFHNVGIAAQKTNFVDLAKRAEGAVARGDMAEIDRMALESEFSELGRFLVSKNRSDIGAFKTSLLRDIVITAPYMHDGSLATLWDVMDHYNKGGINNPFLDGGIQRLGLTEEEIDDLVELMNAFTSSRYADQARSELARQRNIAANNRPERDTDAAMGRKGHFGDIIPDPDPDQKDAARIGGRPITR
jgi:cytochrome c peroxidase